MYKYTHINMPMDTLRLSGWNWGVLSSLVQTGSSKTKQKWVLSKRQHLPKE